MRFSFKTSPVPAGHERPRPSPRTLRLVAWFIHAWTAVALVVGVGVALIGARDWDRANASVGWPTAPGVVTESRVSHTTRTKRGRTTHSHSPHVTYRYEVDGRERTASLITFRPTGSSESEAREVVARYPVGAAVTVHHAPGDPELACLEPGPGERQWVPLVAGGGIVLLGVGSWWVLRRVLKTKAGELARADAPAA